VDKNGSYRLVKTCSIFFYFEALKRKFIFFILKVCNEINDGHIAVIAIGDSHVFLNLYAITNSLKIPYISIKWDSVEDSNSIVSFSTKLNNEFEDMKDIANQDGSKKTNKMNTKLEDSLAESDLTQINLYPPAHKLMKAVLDLVNFYNWDYVTILFQEFDSLYRIEDLIRLQKKTRNEKLQFNVKPLGSNVKNWINLFKEIKLSGSCHIIVDIQARYLNDFFEMVNYRSKN
jgi:hypothetical protein